MAIADQLSSAGIDISEERERYGELLQNADLPTIVGNNSIHQFLSGLITKIEVFECQLVEKGGEGQVSAILAAVESAGRAKAKEIIAENGAGEIGLSDIGKLLNDNQLEGMPCDPPASFDQSTEGVLGYNHSACNHMGNWQFTSVDPKVMCDITNAWISGFVTELSPSAGIEVKETLASGGSCCSATIKIGD